MSLGEHERKSLERPISTAGQLLVEGRVPQMFFRELVQHMGLTDILEVRTSGDVNKDTLQTYLEIFASKAKFKETVKRVGIIRDAESKPAMSAFNSVQAALQEANLVPPATMKQMEGSPLGVGVFILPDCQKSGMLESLCLEAFVEKERDSKQQLIPCVDELFSCLSKQGQKPSNSTKARFAGCLLAYDVVDPQLGRGAQQGVIPWEASVWDELKGFLRQVAGR
jgi:hypothetical protein